MALQEDEHAFKLKAAYQAVEGSPGGSPRPSKRSSSSWQPSAAWLPVAALCGALLTLAVMSLSGSGTLRWRELTGAVGGPTTQQLPQRPSDAAQPGRKEAAGRAAACPPAEPCPACPQALACPPAQKCPVCPPQQRCPACDCSEAAAAAAAAAAEAALEEEGEAAEVVAAAAAGKAGPTASGRAPSAPAAAKGAAAAVAAASAAGVGLSDEWMQRLRVPWGPLLTQEEAQRGLAYYGSGQRLQAVVNKLMDGKPIKVFTLGASVTRGIGTTDRKHSYANRLFEYIAHAFPHKGHVFINRGIGGTSSSIYSVCAEHMVHKDADLIVLEFSANDKKDAPYTDPERRGYEQLVRKLLQLPGRPALIQLHHYAWWHAVGDGVSDGGLFYHPAGEAQLGVFASYYDFPAVSVRAAMWHLMRAGVRQFKPDAVRKGADKSPTDVAIPGAAPGTEEDYWYKDRTHPADEGHGMLAELLAHVIARAVVDTLAPRPVLHLPGRTADLSPAQDEHGLPLPMVPGNAATPTSLCAIEEDFQGTVVANKGWQYAAQRPDAKNFVEQKWGWVSTTPGAWAEMQFDTESGYADPSGNATDQRAQVSLSYLRSYQGMGVADLACVSGCECEPQVLDGTWQQEVSLQQILQIWVSRHKQCRIRVTVSERPGQVPQKGHKVVLQGVMVSHFGVRLTTYDEQVSLLHQASIPNKGAP